MLAAMFLEQWQKHRDRSIWNQQIWLTFFFLYGINIDAILSHVFDEHTSNIDWYFFISKIILARKFRYTVIFTIYTHLF